MIHAPMKCTQDGHAYRLMDSSYLWNCSMMSYFSIRWLDGRAMATMSSVTLQNNMVQEREILLFYYFYSALEINMKKKKTSRV